MTRSRSLPEEYIQIGLDVAEAFGVPLEALTYPLRGSPREAEARQALMYMLHEVYALSFTRIAQILGRYRKTVSWGVERTKKRMKGTKFRATMDLVKYGC